jgi:hypothetical protein
MSVGGSLEGDVTNRWRRTSCAKLCNGVDMRRSTDQTRELLFEFRIGHRTVACELSCHGESGVEAQFIESDGRVGLSQRFSTRAMAVEWAEEHQRMMQRELDGRDVEV